MTKDDTKKDQDPKVPPHLLKENNPAIAKIIEDMQQGTTIEQDQEPSKHKLPEQKKEEQINR